MDDARKVVVTFMRSGILIAFLLAASAAGNQRLAAQEPGAHAPAEDARNTDIRTTETHLPLPEFTSLKAWEQRRTFLRNQIGRASCRERV